MRNMKCWSTRLSEETNNNKNKHVVKLSQLKLELGLFGARVASSKDKVAIEISGSSRINNINDNSSRNSKAKRRRCIHTTSNRRFLSNKTSSLLWDAPDLCGFHLLLKDVESIHCIDMAFHVLYGEGGVGESSAKMTVAGKVSVSVAMVELLLSEEMKTESNSWPYLQRRIPIKLKVNGLCIEATLSVCMRLLKLRDYDDDDSEGPFENLVKSKKQGILGKMKYLTNLTKKKNDMFDEIQQPSPYESDGSPVFDSDDSSSYESTTSSGSGKSCEIHNTESRITNGSERFTKTSLDTLQKSWSQMSWNRSLKGWNFKANTSKQETLSTYPGSSRRSDELSLQFYLQHNARNWEMRQISSRDGQAKLKTNVFFASFDQRSSHVSGEGACTVLVLLIAHFLHCNKQMPTRSQFDTLIKQGSSEWRKLCKNDHYSNLFPDKHFDLETIIEANLRPLVVLPQKSYTGFFSPEKFHCLKGAMSFDEIWDEINNKKGFDNEPRIYIVSWNDHFFVLKVESDACYIIDSLGERLFEGCHKAFILKFDEWSVMYGKEGKVMANGKECCKEFIKRFLAAIPIGQVEKEEKKWRNVSSSHYLQYRKLQIDFHYSSLLSLSISASSLLSSLKSAN